MAEVKDLNLKRIINILKEHKEEKKNIRLKKLVSLVLM